LKIYGQGGPAKRTNKKSMVSICSILPDVQVWCAFHAVAFDSVIYSGEVHYAADQLHVVETYHHWSAAAVGGNGVTRVAFPGLVFH